MDAVLVIALAFVFLCGCPLLAGWIADRKGRSVLPWALIGLVFGILGVVFAAVVPRAEPSTRAQAQEP